MGNKCTVTPGMGGPSSRVSFSMNASPPLLAKTKDCEAFPELPWPPDTLLRSDAHPEPHSAGFQTPWEKGKQQEAEKEEAALELELPLSTVTAAETEPTGENSRPPENSPFVLTSVNKAQQQA